MASTRFVHRTLTRLMISITIILIFWNEFVAYSLHKYFWNQIECRTDNCTRILFVADPQLLGYEFDKSFYSSLALMDADRYLENTYRRAVHFAKPNIVCFLGDLLDEGSVATNEQFKMYAQRFDHLFHIDKNLKYIHIPGDNDIGGENGEYISNSNVRRFEIEFTSNDIFDYEHHLRFFKINRMLMDFANPNAETNRDRLRIGISHMPILSAGGPVLRSVLKELDPHVMFSAHWHDSRIFVYPSSAPSQFYERRVETFDLEQIKAEHDYLEIGVPTASYRMGKYKIGYGMAVIENSTLRYTVLWTLTRFLFLGLYLSWIVIALAFLILLQLKRRCIAKLFKRQHSFSRISLIPDF